MGIHRKKIAFSTTSHDPDNIIPVTPKTTTDNVLFSAGHLFKAVGMDAIIFCMFLESIDKLKELVNRDESLEVIILNTDSPSSPKNTPKVKSKRHDRITDEMVAESLGLTPREFRYLKGKAVLRLSRAIQSVQKTALP